MPGKSRLMYGLSKYTSGRMVFTPLRSSDGHGFNAQSDLSFSFSCSSVAAVPPLYRQYLLYIYFFLIKQQKQQNLV